MLFRSIPFPAATDDHQFHNASAFARSGAALLLPQRTTTPQVLARETLKLTTNPVRREAMATALAHWHAPDAAARIAQRILALAGLNCPERSAPEAGQLLRKSFPHHESTCAEPSAARPG